MEKKTEYITYAIMITITGKGKGKPKVFIRCINELIYVTTVVALYDCTLDEFTFLFM